MSSKSVAEKMYIKPGMRVGFFNAPDNLMELLGGVPDDVDIQDFKNGHLDLVLGFIENRKMLQESLINLKNAVKDNGALWLAYIKGSSSIDTDINRDSIQEFGQQLDLKGVAMISINEDWSGFRFKKI